MRTQNNAILTNIFNLGKSQMLIKIPIRIVSEANSSDHWTKKSKRHKIQKLIVKSYLQKYKLDLNPPYTICLKRHAPRAYDSDNLQSAFKWVRDSLSEYLLGGIIAGQSDNDPRIIWKYDHEKTMAKEYYITIEVLSQGVRA